MVIVNKLISIEELKKMAQRSFGDLVKVVVDVERKIMVVDGELHADQEALLIENGSKQENLWGINIYPSLKKDEWIEFDSIINLRPSQGNRTRSIDNPKIQELIKETVNNLVE